MMMSSLASPDCDLQALCTSPVLQREEEEEEEETRGDESVSRPPAPVSVLRADLLTSASARPPSDAHGHAPSAAYHAPPGGRLLRGGPSAGARLGPPALGHRHGRWARVGLNTHSGHQGNVTSGWRVLAGIVWKNLERAFHLEGLGIFARSLAAVLMEVCHVAAQMYKAESLAAPRDDVDATKVALNGRPA